MRLGNFYVKWQHDQEKGFTYVQVIGDDHPLPRSESFSVKHPKDSYNKAIGRKTSLKRALEKTEPKLVYGYFQGEDAVYEEVPLFTKEERTAIWKDYREKFETSKEPSPFTEVIAQKDAEIAKLKRLVVGLVIKNTVLNLFNKIKA